MFLEMSLPSVVIIYFLISHRSNVKYWIRCRFVDSFRGTVLFSIMFSFFTVHIFVCPSPCRKALESVNTQWYITHKYHARRTGYKYTEFERLESYCGQLFYTIWCMMGFAARAVVFLFTNIIAIQIRTTSVVCTAHSLSGQLSLTVVVSKRCLAVDRRTESQYCHWNRRPTNGRLFNSRLSWLWVIHLLSEILTYPIRGILLGQCIDTSTAFQRTRVWLTFQFHLQIFTHQPAFSDGN